MSKFIVVNAGNIWALAEDVDGSGVSYGALNLTDYQTLKAIADRLNAGDESAAESVSAESKVDADNGIDARIAALGAAGVDAETIRTELETQGLNSADSYANLDSAAHFDFYQFDADRDYAISVCGEFVSAERFIERIEEQAKEGGWL